MATNRSWEAKGSYKEGENKVEFVVTVDGYTEDKAGFKAMCDDYGIEKIVQIVNKARETAQVNSERRRLTEGDAVLVKTKKSAFDEIASASTMEEKLAVMKKYGLA